MQAHVLTGTKQQIAEGLAQMPGEVREAIVFVEEPTETLVDRTRVAMDIFAEMHPFMVDAECVDDSREAIYTQMEGE